LTTEKKILKHSLIFPIFFVFIIWMVKLYEEAFGISMVSLGIYPLKAEGLIGIITSPLIHADFKHLYANTFPLLTLSIGIFYFYRKIAYKIFFLSYFLTGLWLWFGATSQGYHIGASGLVYAFASFLFFSGAIRNDIRLLALSLIITFLYGGMIWGIFPLKPGVSWESHLLGGIAGLILAIYYRKQGPARIKYEWEEDDDDDDHDDTGYYFPDFDAPPDDMKYIYREEEEE